MKLARIIGAVAAALSITRVAAAGGMTVPDNGTEALGRGGAFTAKADDPTAIYYNIAGLAQQRGTRFLANANLSHATLDFQRAGTYPGDPAKQSYAGKAFPLAESQGGITTVPFLALTSDFGLENVTFALGTFAPPVGAGRVYPLTTSERLPSPVRYESIGGGPSSILLWHTAAVAFKLGDYVELGLAAHVAQIVLGERVIQYEGDLCDNKSEDPKCDARGDATTKGWSGTGSIGAMVRPTDSVSIGLNFMGPTRIIAEGNVKIAAPPAVKLDIPPTRAAIGTALPWVIRAGVRKTFGEVAGRRTAPTTGDLELDATYEGWGAAMNPGPMFAVEKIPGKDGPVVSTSARYWDNTFSVRAGGSVTPDLPIALTLRGGAYFDQSATSSAYTNVGTDTLHKVALTTGAGVRFDAWRLDLAYASVFDVSRNVTDGANRSSSDKDASITNNGYYSGHSHIASIGATIELDVLVRGVRLPSVPRGEQQQLAQRTDRHREHP